MHKAAALAHLQKDGAQGRDARAGSHALRDGREAVDYRRGRGRHRFCVLRVQLYYEIHVDGEGVPLNAGSSLMLEGTLHTSVMCVSSSCAISTGSADGCTQRWCARI